MRTKSIYLIWPQLIILPNMWQEIQRKYLLFEIKNSLPACFNSDDFQDSGISIETNLYGHSLIQACFSSYVSKLSIAWYVQSSDIVRRPQNLKKSPTLRKCYLVRSNQSERFLHIIAGFSENLNFTSILPNIIKQ